MAAAKRKRDANKHGEDFAVSSWQLVSARNPRASIRAVLARPRKQVSMPASEID